MESVIKRKGPLAQEHVLRRRFAGIVIVGVVVDLVFGPVGSLGAFRRPAEGSKDSTGLVIPGFMGDSIGEVNALSTTLAVLVSGRVWITRVVGACDRSVAIAMWLLGLVPHTAAHRYVGEDLGGLLAIEWMFPRRIDGHHRYLPGGDRFHTT